GSPRPSRHLLGSPVAAASRPSRSSRTAATASTPSSRPRCSSDLPADPNRPRRAPLRPFFVCRWSQQLTACDPDDELPLDVALAHRLERLHDLGCRVHVVDDRAKLAGLEQLA